MAKKRLKEFEDVPMLDVAALPPEPVETRATRLKETWRPTPEEMHKIRVDFPTVDVDEELEKFMDWHLAKGTKHVIWYRALRTWLRNARDFREKGRRTPVRKGPPGSPIQETAPVYNPAEALRQDEEPW